MRYGNKNVTSLCEDFEKLGIIKQKNNNADLISESSKKSKLDKLKEAREKKLAEQKNKKNKSLKLQEAKKKKLAKLKEQKRKAYLLKKKKIAEARKRKAVAEAKKGQKNTKPSVSSALKNIMAIESELQKSSRASDVMETFKNVKRVSQIALKKLSNLSEQDIDQEKQKGSKNEIGTGVDPDFKDMTSENPKEGNPKSPKGDDLDSSETSTNVPVTTGAEAGKPAHKDPKAKELSTVGEGYEEDDDMRDMDYDMDEDDMDVDDMSLDDEELDDEMLDDEEDLDVDLDVDSDVVGDEFDDEELDIDIGDDEGFDDMGDDVDVDLDDEDDEMMDDEDLDDEMLDDEEDEGAMESSKPNKKDYVAELKSIVKESDNVLEQMRSHAITPERAESLLKDILSRLGGSVGDVTSMMQNK